MNWMKNGRTIFIFCLYLVFNHLLAAFSVSADQKDSRLEGLLRDLRNASGMKEASALENRIWQIWMQHHNPAIQDSLAEGVSAMRRRNYSEALKHFGLLTRIEPEFAEGWNKRATVLYLMGRYGESEADVYKTLLLEPRHFGALSGMGLIRIARKDWGGAVDALESGLKIHPNMPGALKNLEFARKKQKESMT